MSKRIVCAFVALFILISSFALSGANFNFDDSIIEEIPSAQVHFANIPGKVDTLEADFALQAVNSQIGHDCYGGYVEPLYNAEGQAEYLLAEAEDGGYAIYHRVTGDLMELGEFGSSPYDGQTGKKYYFGPSNYAVKNDSETVDVMRNTVMDVEDLQTASSYMTSIRTEIVSKSEVKNYEERLNKLYSFRDDNLNSVQNIPGVIWENKPFNNDVNISDFKNIMCPEIYTFAKSSSEFGNNTSGSCIFISTVLLMRYLDYVIEGGLIPDTISAIPEQWKTLCDGHVISSSSTKSSQTGNSSYDCTIKDSDSTYEALHKVLICCSMCKSFGKAGWSVSSYNTLYLPQCITLVNTKNTSSNFNTIKTQIDANNPIAFNIYTYDYNDQNQIVQSSLAHVVVAYGYLTVNNTNYIRTHFGWDNYSSVIVPDIYMKGTSNYLSVTKSHAKDQTHVCNYKSLAGNDCFYNSEHKYYSTHTSHRCACGLNEIHSDVGALSMFDQNTISDFLGSYANESMHFTLCGECCDYFEYAAPTITNTDRTTRLAVAFWIEAYNTKRGWETITAPHRWQIDEDGDSVCIDCGFVRS